MASRRRWAIAIGLSGLAALTATVVLVARPRMNASPYPPSPVIAGYELDWRTHQRLAPGSGDWAITWADDDHQYTAWGNGGGFGGTEVDGRVYLGFARVEGPKDDYQAHNVWGGKAPENDAQFGGKSYGIISVDGKLYMWRCGDTDGLSALDFQELHVSTDHSATWSSTGVKFTRASALRSAATTRDSSARSSSSSARTTPARATNTSTATLWR
jgi:hypothetical protein